MTDIFVQRSKAGAMDVLIPAHESDLEAIKKLPKGQPLRCKVTRMRNVGHHRKYYALLNYAFDCWTPDEDNMVGEKNFDRFRKDLIILAGFYEQYVRVDGSTRIEPKSISFANMDQDTFEELYSKTIDAIIKHVLRNYTGDELRALVEQLESFE